MTRMFFNKICKIYYKKECGAKEQVLFFNRMGCKRTSYFLWWEWGAFGQEHLWRAYGEWESVLLFNENGMQEK